MNRSLNEEGDQNGSKLYVFNMYLKLNTSYVINKKLFLIRKILSPQKIHYTKNQMQRNKSNFCKLDITSSKAKK